MTKSYFSEKEMMCKCGCGNSIQNSELLKMLEDAREIAKIPFVINSWYRCENHNKNVGGVKNSAHTYGLATDIKIKSSRDRYLILNSLFKVGFKRVSVYSNFIHVDIDNSKSSNVVWYGN